METRKESLSSLKVCRFCLTQNETLSSLYEKSKAPKNSVTLSTKIMTCVAIEVFPSDKMPQYICSRCKLFMDLSYGFKQICRQADQNILHFVQNGTTIEPLAWPSLLNKVYKAHLKSEFGVVKTVTQDGATVKVTAEEVSDSEEGDDDNVYSVKIGDGSEQLKSIKVITSVDKQVGAKDNRKNVKYELDSEDEPAQIIVKEGCWPCDECECTYPLEQLLTLHKAQKHRARHVECTECDAKFFTKYDLMTHQLRHSSEFPFQCVACDKKFKRLVLLKRHEKLMHSDLPQIKCLKCPATFLSQIELDAHMTKHLSNSSRQYQCTICDKRFVEKCALQRHLETIHKKKPEFDCNYCPERFSNMTKLGKHLRSHAGERAYPCKHCDKSFLKSHHYTRHLRVKHSETLRQSSNMFTEGYRCEECEECFNTQDELIYHSALHATRSLTCPLCQEKFNDVDTVTAHIKSHVNGAEFMCDFCELIFTTQEKLDTHIVVSHDNELNDKDTTENEEEDYSMDAEAFEEEHLINLKEEDGHMVVEIKKAGDYMMTDTVSTEEYENNVIDQSEGSELEISLNDATGPLLASKPAISDQPPKPIPAKRSDIPLVKANPGVSIMRLDISKVNTNIVTNASKPTETIKESPSIAKKAEEIKQTTVQKQPSPVPNAAVVKEKHTKVESSVTVTPTPPAPANDLSLRLLEKELQDLQRTNTRNDVAKTPAKSMESLKNKRSQIHTSTPKPRPIEKKETPAPKSAPERPLQEKTPKSAVEKPVSEKRPIGRPPKENREVKNIIKEEKDPKDKSAVSFKEEKEIKEVKDEKETPKVVKNGATESASVEEPVRRSTRPSKVKDYAKMIGDSPDEDEETTDDEEMEEPKEAEISTETPRRGRKPLPKPSPAVPTLPPGTAPRKRGRPRKSLSAVPPKVSKKEENQDKEESEEESEPTVTEESKPAQEESKEADVTKTETKSPTAESTTNVIVSPSGQTLKKVPIKALPPGVKPMPLPRKMASGEVCEMQIGKKVVKVQKIVMTKAEVEAMTKKGLVEMKDGTIVLKQGIKLPGGGASTLKSQLAEEQKKESPKEAKPTRCNIGDQ